MKKLYPYNKFVNEGVRDKMTPVSLDEMWENSERYIDNSIQLSNVLSTIISHKKPYPFRDSDDVMYLLFTFIPDTSVNIKDIADSLKKVDSMLAFGIKHVYSEIWDKIPREMRLESVKKLKTFIDNEKDS